MRCCFVVMYYRCDYVFFAITFRKEGSQKKHLSTAEYKAKKIIEQAEVLKESLEKQLEKIKKKEKGEPEQETKGIEPEKHDDGRED